MKPLPLLFCLLLIPALACSTTSITESLAPSGSVLYQDYFSNTKSGWEEYTSPAGTAGYTNDAYHIVINQANVNLWTHPGLEYTSTREEVSVMPVSGPQSNRMGLICRLKDNKNFYFFVISGDGYYGIGKVKNGQAGLLSGSAMKPNSAILTGAQDNRLRADCSGSQLTFYVNNVKLASATDAEYSSGDIGLLAGSFDQTGSDIYFDNFIVYKP